MSPAEIRDCLVAAGLVADSRYYRFKTLAVCNAAKPGGKLWRLAQQVAVNGQALIDQYRDKTLVPFDDDAALVEAVRASQRHRRGLTAHRPVVPRHRAPAGGLACGVPGGHPGTLPAASHH